MRTSGCPAGGQIKGDGFPRQLTAIKTHAEAHGVHIVKVFRERGVTGTTEGLDRPAWSEMLTEMRESGVPTVIVEKLDRLARDLMVQETIIRDMKKAGFTLMSVAEPDLCSTDATRVMMRQIMGAVAQYDKAQIVSKLRGARERARATNGRCEGAKPYGTLPGEAVHLGTMRTLRAAGESLTAIAAYLDRNGVKTRRGTKWHPYAVSRILDRSSDNAVPQEGTESTQIRRKETHNDHLLFGVSNYRN